MGIHGIYKEIGPGVRIALSKLAVQKFEQSGRPLRLAIDTSIWLFQIQSSKGGTNPALRTFYYRLLRLMSLSIHPLFVFDGPNKPPFKRNKRVGGPNVQVASIPEFLAKQLLKQFGFPFHLAPGEAEAECALLQREGIVDAVLSEDVDTLMFGSGTTIRNWSAEGSKSKTPTHVNLYEAADTKTASGLDREGMVLVALMSGGDYIPAGIPGCGPKTACEAARAGFGKDLCSISRGDTLSLKSWRERLEYELHTNESKHFRTKHSTIAIPGDFPNPDVLGYYTHPVISSREKIERLKQSLKWDMDIDYPALREFTADAFSWTKLGGAKHFIRGLAHPLLVRELRMRGQRAENGANVHQIEQEEARLVTSIHGTRTHASTDNSSEMRIAFTPHTLVPIDLENEEPDDEFPEDENPDDDNLLEPDEAAEAPGTQSKRRVPTKYDPKSTEKVWILEPFVRVGVPLKVQDWEASFRDPNKYLNTKNANKALSKSKGKASKTGGMQHGALEKFTKTTKPGVHAPVNQSKVTVVENLHSASQPVPRSSSSISTARQYPGLGSTQFNQRQPDVLSLLSSSPPRPQDIVDAVGNADLPSTVTKRRRRSPLTRSQTSPASLFAPNISQKQTVPRPATPPLVSELDLTMPYDSPSSSLSPSQLLPQKKVKTSTSRQRNSTTAPTQSKASNVTTSNEAIVLSSSPPRTIDAWIRRSQSVTPQKAKASSASTSDLAAGREENSSQAAHLEIRTLRIEHNLRASRSVVAEMDLTDSMRLKAKKSFPKPASHLTPAAIGKLGASYEGDGPECRRKWTQFPALTETSGNQAPAGISKCHPHFLSGENVNLPVQQRTQLSATRPKQVEKIFVRLGSGEEGFWEETIAARLSVKGMQARKTGKEAHRVWALDELDVIDMTSPS